MKTKILFLVGFFLISNCNSREDNNYTWLLTILSTVAPVSAPGVSDTTTTPVTVNVTDVSGNSEFVFDTTRTVPIRITIVDPIAPVAGSLVQIRDLDQGSGGRLIFQAVTSESGNVTGSFTITNHNPRAELSVTIDGVAHRWIINLTNVQEVSRYLYINANVQYIAFSDRDSDGVEDSADAYPDDPGRSALVKIPTDSWYTIAFEDLYPNQGDADFNDYVLQARFEEDLNSRGEVVRSRAFLKHIARGAGYNHTLRLKYNDAASGTYILERFTPTGEKESMTAKAFSAGEFIEAMPTSNTTLASWNSRNGEAYQPGKSVKLETIFTSPVNKISLGGAPYRIHLHVNNTNKDIYFAGKQFGEDGKDLYIDKDGFPWALLMPIPWRWPYERLNIHGCYTNFRSWYSSAGKDFTNWYQEANSNCVYPAPAFTN